MTATTMVSVPPATIVSPNEQHPASSIASRIQDWLGHSVSAVGAGLSKVGSTVIGAVQKTISVASVLVGDSTATAGVLRKLDHHVLRLIEHINNAPGSLARFQSFVKHNVAFIDLAQLSADIQYVVSGKFKEDNNVMVCGKLAALAANTGGALLWFKEMGFLSLRKIADAIGEVRLFSAVPSILSSIPALNDCPKLHQVANAIGEFRAFSFLKQTTCLFLTLRALDLMYACFAIDAGRRLLDAESQVKAISAGIELSSYLAELTLSAIMLAGVTNVVTLGVAGATCIALTVASFVYRTSNDAEIRKA